MPSHGLSDHQLQVLCEVLAGYSDRITRVGLFGSRASGAARPNSDIDLVLYGNLQEPDVDHIWTEFEESSLSIGVDVVAYALVDYPPLKQHIDSTMIPLFSTTDLQRARANA